MPCNSDHMKANGWEIGLSKTLCVLDELEGKRPRPCDWHGYHPLVYCQNISKIQGDAVVKSACKKLGKMTKAGIQKLSLEAQMWWRDHQAADKARRAGEK